ncbi:hypothetical protein ABZY44_08080 [Streptomyces sp. NPDC006544]|uniref:hypothetical protein n=1 Tax=Streptomyces sp. NPDC006544 TaxID=3154583 RepID=UPI0033B55C02
MGIKEQFQDKAKSLEEKARAAAAAGPQDETSERATRTGDRGEDRARDAFDENFDK